jgi:AraC-like DNA-binding protein
MGMTADPAIRTPDGIPDVALVAGPAQHYGGHVHEELKLALVSGTGFTVRRRGREFQAAPGQLIALHADDVTSGSPEDPEAAHWLIMCVSPGLIAEVVAPEQLRFEDPVLAGGGLSKRFQHLHQHLYEPAVTHSGDGLEAETRLLEFVSALASRSSTAEGASAAGSGAGTVAEVVRDYLRENLARNVTLDELTQVAGVSKYRLVRLCTAHYGLPPHKLHQGLRLDWVRELLRRGAGIAEAAYETGFHDQPHLTRTFARTYGMTPAVYRARARTYKTIDLRAA